MLKQYPLFYITRVGRFPRSSLLAIFTKITHFINTISLPRKKRWFFYHDASLFRDGSIGIGVVAGYKNHKNQKGLHGKLKYCFRVLPSKANSSIIGEYIGLLKAMEIAKTLKLNHLPINFCGDNAACMKGITKEFNMKKGKQGYEFMQLGYKYKVQFPKAKFHWVPRELNEEADKLSRVVANVIDINKFYD